MFANLISGTKVLRGVFAKTAKRRRRPTSGVSQQGGINSGSNYARRLLPLDFARGWMSTLRNSFPELRMDLSLCSGQSPGVPVLSPDEGPAGRKFAKHPEGHICCEGHSGLNHARRLLRLPLDSSQRQQKVGVGRRPASASREEFIPALTMPGDCFPLTSLGAGWPL